jgi:hypothetical protein
MTLYYNNEGNIYEAEKYADMLIKDFPDNPTFHRWKGKDSSKKRRLLSCFRNIQGCIEEIGRELFRV